MVLDIELFRQNPQLIYDSQAKRGKGLEHVDQVIKLDSQWRTLRYQLDQWNRVKRLCGRIIKKKYQAKENEGDSDELPPTVKIDFQTLDADGLDQLTIRQIKRVSILIDTEIERTQGDFVRIDNERNSSLREVGNLVHQSVPVSDDEVKINLFFEWFMHIVCLGKQYPRTNFWRCGYTKEISTLSIDAYD